MIKRSESNHRMSQVVEYDSNSKFVQLAGQVSDDPELDIAGQTRSILSKIDQKFGEAGVSRENMVSAMIWLASAGDFDEMNKVWDNWVPSGHAPARACVEARLADPRLKVEIQILAVK